MVPFAVENTNRGIGDTVKGFLKNWSINYLCAPVVKQINLRIRWSKGLKMCLHECQLGKNNGPGQISV